jgi:hypothetical protein
MTQAESDFQAAIKDLREVAVDLEVAAKISAIADRLVEAKIAIMQEAEKGSFKKALREIDDMINY